MNLYSLGLAVASGFTTYIIADNLLLTGICLVALTVILNAGFGRSIDAFSRSNNLVDAKGNLIKIKIH